MRNTENNKPNMPEGESNNENKTTDTTDLSIPDSFRVPGPDNTSVEYEATLRQAIMDDFIELSSREVELLFRIMGISSAGRIAEQMDRLYRYELRETMGPSAASWCMEKDTQIDPLQLSIKLPKHDITIRTFLNERSKPDSEISRLIRDMLNKNEKPTALPSDGASKLWENRGAIPKRSLPSINSEEILVPGDGISVRNSGLINHDKSRRVTFYEPGRVTSSPIPPSKMSDITNDRRETTNIDMQRGQRFMMTPEISRVPPANTTYLQERSAMGWESNSVAHDAHTLPRRTTNENVTGTVQRIDNDTHYYQSKYAPTNDQSIITRDSYPFDDNPVEIVSDKVHKAGNQLMRRGIKFSGKADEDPEEYLRLLAGVIRQFGIREHEALSLVPYTLEMPAMSWYRIEERHFQSYFDFYKKFKERYAPRNNQSHIWEELNTRVQGQGETVSEYIGKMQQLFSCLTREPPLAQQIDIVYEGLLPRYVMQIDIESIRTYSDLLNQIRKYESKMCVASRHARSLPVDRNNIGNAGYDRRNRSRALERGIVNMIDDFEEVQIDEVTGNDEIVEIKPEKMKAIEPEKKIPGPSYICFNCGKPGHYMRECPEPRKKRFVPRTRSIATNTETPNVKIAAITNTESGNE